MKVIGSLTMCFMALIVASCNNKLGQNNEAVDIPIDTENSSVALNKEMVKDLYFKAMGSEPFWRLEISENQIKLITIEDSITTPHVTPIQAMDANVKRYAIQTESSQMTIQMAQSECTNPSGALSPYSVKIDYKKNTDKDFIKMNGCGEYITNYRLHDIWALEQLNGSYITKSDFNKEFPTMEINASTNTFLGFAGCNRMSGSLFFEKGLLRFTKIVTTEMMCISNKEPEFLKALQSSTTYKIENNRLSLSNPNGVVLVFKKID